MVFFVLGLMNSAVLTPLNRLWMRFGLFLHRIISPIILGLTYFTVISGTGMILRWLGKDPIEEGSINRRPATGLPAILRDRLVIQ